MFTASARCLLCLAILCALAAQAAPKRADLQALDRLPLTFEPNLGQAAEDSKFISRARGYTLLLKPTEIVLASWGAQPVRVTLAGANPAAKAVPLEELGARSNYFIGRDPRAWRTNVPNYARVRYESVYPGIDLVWYGKQRQAEFDFIVEPGADPKAIRLIAHGATPRLDATGDLLLGPARLHKPRIYQGDKQIAGGFTLRGRSIGFQVAAYDRMQPLVIDPVLTYAAFIRGNGLDRANAVAVDATGNAYVIGATSSTNLPTATPFQGANRGAFDVFVAKLNPTGTALLYLTYLGGAGLDFGFGIAVDSGGNAYLTGATPSRDFPLVNALQPTKGETTSLTDAFVAKLNPTGNTLLYSSFLGGNGNDTGRGIALDPAGNVYVAGGTSAPNFPTQNGFQMAPGGAQDAFIVKFTASFGRVYATLVGGSGDDGANAIRVDADANAYVTGFTSSTNLPTENAFQPTFGGQFDAFVVKVNAQGNDAVSLTYLGGSGQDGGFSIDIDTARNIYVAGVTASSNFPIRNAFQPNFGGAVSSGGAAVPSGDGFVTKLNASGTELVYSTFLGGGGDDIASGIAVDSAGNAFVAGTTDSPNFPILGGAIQVIGGGGAFKYDGVKWRFANYGMSTSIVNDIAINPANREEAFAATLRGLLRSRDSANTWLQTVLTADSRAIVIDPVVTSTMYIATTSGLFKSTDGGDTFLTSLAADIRSLAISQNNNLLVYAGAVSGQVFKTVNGGTNWTSAGTGQSRPLHDLVINPDNDQVVLVGAGDSTGGQLLRSTDGGSTFAAIGNGLPANQSVNEVVINPVTPATIFVGTNTGLAAAGGIYRSTDGGVNFTRLARTGGDVTALAIDPANPNTLHMGLVLDAFGFSFGYGVLRSPDGGVTWTAMGLDNTRINDIEVDPAITDVLLVATAGGNDTFLVGFGADGQPIDSALHGGTGSDAANGIAVTGDGKAIIAGVVGSRDLTGTTAAVGAGPPPAPTPRAADVPAEEFAELFLAAFQLVGLGSQPPIVEKSASPDPAIVGQDLTYTIRITNKTGREINDVQLTDDLAAAPTVGTPATNRGSCEIRDAKLTCNIGTMRVLDVITITYKVKPNSAERLVNEAIVRLGDRIIGRRTLSTEVKPHPAPHISNTSPGSGPAGTQVTIQGAALSTGANTAPVMAMAASTASFGADAIVRFNGVVAAVLSNTASRIVAVVPTGATTGPITVTTPGGAATSRTSFTVTPGDVANQPITPAGGTVNGASFTPALAPGSIASLFGQRLASGLVEATSVPLPTTLGNATVTFNDPVAAGLFFVSAGQINLQIPWELEGQREAYLAANVSGVISNPALVPLATYAPGIFTMTATGCGQGAIIVATTGEIAAPEGSIPGRAARPVRRGEFLTIFCTGLGPVTNRPASRAVALASPLSTTTANPTVTIGGVNAPVSFSGLAPGFVGLYQVNVQVPDNAPNGAAVDLALTIGGAVSNTVTIAVQ